MTSFEILQQQDNSVNASSLKAVVKYSDFWGKAKYLLFTMTAKEKGLDLDKALKDVFSNEPGWNKNTKGTGYYYILKTQRGITWFHQVRHDYVIPENKAAARRAKKQQQNTDQ